MRWKFETPEHNIGEEWSVSIFGHCVPAKSNVLATRQTLATPNLVLQALTHKEQHLEDTAFFVAIGFNIIDTQLPKW